MTDPQSTPRATPGEWTLAIVLAANLIWTSLCLGGYRPETMVWSWLLTGASFAIHWALAAFDDEAVHPASWFVVPFLAYGALNAFWVSPVPWLAWRDWLGWAQIAGTFVLCLNGVRRPGPRQVLLVTLAVLGVIAVVLAGYQRFLWPDWLMLGRKQAPQFIGRASGFFGAPNSMAAFLLLLIPPLAALTLQRGAGAIQRVLCGYLAVVFLIGLGLTISRGAWLALLAAFLVWPLCIREKPLEWRVTVSLVAIAAVALMGIAVYSGNRHVKARLDSLVNDFGERSRPILWQASWNLFKSAPVAGTGAGSYDVLFERHRPSGFRDDPAWAHSEYLNTLSDYGLVGFVLSFGAMGLLAVRCVRRARANTPTRPAYGTVPLTGVWQNGVTRGLAMGLFAFAVAIAVDFHMKIPAVAMAVAVLAAECVLRTWPVPAPRPSSPFRPLLAIGGVIFVVVLALGLALPTYRGDAPRLAAREAVDALARMTDPSTNVQKDVLASASQRLAEACALNERNGQSWADRAYVTALWARVSAGNANALGREAEQLARTALEKSTVVPEFWVRLGVALDLQGRWGEAGECFTHALQLAPKSANAWYYYAYHLSLIPATRILAGTAVHTALTLDPGLRPAITLQKSLSLAAEGR